MLSVIIGYGEIGKALYKNLSGVYKVAVKDLGEKYTIKGTSVEGSLNFETGESLVATLAEEDVAQREVDVLHVCIPWSSVFCSTVEGYRESLKPKCIVIHSSVPVGTCRSLNALHSPVQGRHPFLAESMLVYTKFIGGKGASKVADYFRRAGFSVYLTDRQESTELLKLDETTWFATMVEKTKETKALCEQHGVPFELFTVWTEQTNKGLKRLGQEDAIRPNLVPIEGRQGGHCTLPNAEMLQSRFARFVLELNEREEI